MTKFKLAFAIHNHQPVGNFGCVFEQAHKDAYAPFLDLVRKFPSIRLSLHQSGILWSWQEKHAPEYFTLVRSLLDSGQVELLTGGFYEPILTSIPIRDVLGQIGMLSGYIKTHFDVDPSGLWLTERVWEPHLPQVLNQAGVKFLPVDDTHFMFAGLQHSELTGPFVTEHEGATVTLLPIQKRLRYLIPFGTVNEVIAEVRKQAQDNPGGLAVYADDGEKFGVWPNTHQHCYDDGWLEQFFTELERCRDWLEVIPLGEAAALPAVGRAYLPSASYEEMLHWALPAKAFVEYEQFEHWLKDREVLEKWGRFVRGSHWRAFLSKYDESNLMHKKMLSLSQKIAKLEESRTLSADRLAPIRDRLYTSQCNCPYWHGVFGGLYLPHIRQAVYSKMVEAEALIRREAGLSGVQIETLDYDSDGHSEVVVSSDHLSAVFRPTKGGSLVDLSLLKHGFNLTDTLTRRREGYHLKLDRAVTKGSEHGTASIHDLVLAKEPGLKDYLVNDPYTKRCFIDHFFSDDTSVDGFRRGSYGENGDFTSFGYRYQLDPARNAVTLVREGQVRTGTASMRVRLSKQFTFHSESARLDAVYELTRLEGPESPVNFGIENNFSFQAGHAHDRYVVIDDHRPEDSFLDSIGLHRDSHAIAMADEYRKLALAVSSESPAEIWHSPLFTVSLSEAGFEKVYQGTTLMHLYRIALRGEPIRIHLTLTAGRIDEILRRPATRNRATSTL